MSYGEITTFSIKFGKKTSGGSQGQYYGVAFKELGWGGITTESHGTNFTLSYDGNGAASGSPPAPVTKPEGAPVTVAASSFSRPGYIFTGWNTKADGTGSAFSPGNATFVPYLGATLYAQWAVNPSAPLAAADDWYTGQYNTPFVLSAPNSILSNDGPSASPMVVTRALNASAGLGSLAVNFTTGEFVFTPNRGVGPANFTFVYGERATRGVCDAQRAS